MNETHNPDVLSCLANLSNDEVFTPPSVVNQMLDMLPQELFRSSKTTFLDIGCKSGVFLREITKRLIAGLADEMPDLQTRVDHILHKQVFGIATTELTSLVSRRTLYCSKYPNCRYSTSPFKTVEGNIRFRNIPHTFVNGRCKWCGASEDQFGEAKRKGLETHAYEFIHTDHPEEIFNMKFDVIVGNPPYQMSFGIEGANKSNSKQIYNLFMDAAFRLRPRHVVMITKSGWLTKTAQGVPESWIDVVLNSNKFRVMHDFLDSKECFPGVEIKGGVNYFLWDCDYEGRCEYFLHDGKGSVVKRIDTLNTKGAGILIRDPMAIEIIGRIMDVEGDYYLLQKKNFSSMVSPKHFFDKDDVLTSNWDGFVKSKDKEHQVKYYLNRMRFKMPFAWIRKEDIQRNPDALHLHKVYITGAGGSGNDDQVIGVPFYGEPNSVCSQTYLVVGYDRRYSKEECLNIISYMKSRVFRYLVSVKKKTQNGPRGVYQFVPMQDFSKPWTDAELYDKYNLTKDEIAFIESMIKPME